MNTQHYFTREEAAKFIRNFRCPGASVEFSLHCGYKDAPVIDATGNRSGCLSGALSGYVDLSRKEAERWCRRALSAGAEARGARIPISVDEMDSHYRVIWLG